MNSIFISYRRGDSAGHTGRLFADLERRLGRERIFRDVDDLEPGVDFEDAVNNALAQCKVVLVMIGRSWISASGHQGRRLDQKDDLVRVEVASALERRAVRVIPVLVDGATMPISAELPGNLQALAQRNAFELSDTRWDYDVDRLGDALVKYIGLKEVISATTKSGRGHRLGMLMIAAVVGLAILFASYFAFIAGGTQNAVIHQPELPAGVDSGDPPSAPEDPSTNVLERAGGAFDAN